MSNEITKKEDSNIVSLNLGAIDIGDLSPEEQQEMKSLIARKKIDLAFDAKKKELELQSAVANMDATITAMERAKNAGLRVNTETQINTPNGTHKMTIKTKGIFG